MILEIDKKEYQIEDYLTISKYMELTRLEGFINDPIKLLNAYTNIPEELIKKANKDNVNFILNMIQAEYLKHEDNQIFATFEFKGKKYGLQKNFNDINFGGWVDLEMAIAEGVEKNIDTIMAILYRPLKWTLGDQYEIEEYDGETMKLRKIDFQDLPIQYWFGCSTFFLLQGKMFLEIMRNSLDEQQRRTRIWTMWKQRWMKLKSLLNPFKW